jgi:predicted  nucleic acid-binding Zn-ribbon protein
VNKIKHIDDIYSDIKDLIQSLRSIGDMELSSVLDHRMTKVSWTSNSELLEEILDIMKKYQEREDSSNSVLDKIRALETTIVAFLNNSE